MKPCSQCSREIEDDALACPFCGHGVSEPTLTPAQTVARLKHKYHKSKWPVILLILATIGIIVGYILLSKSVTPNGSAQDAWLAGKLLLSIL